MSLNVLILQTHRAQDPKLSKGLSLAQCKSTILVLGRDDVTNVTCQGADLVILDSWSNTQFSKWEHLIRGCSNILWVGEPFMSAPAQVTKRLKRPFDIERLVALLPDVNTQDELVTITLPHCVVDLKRHTVQSGDKNTSLTQQEVRLLAYLANHPNQVITRDALHHDVWDSHGPARGRAAAFAILRLRNKIEIDPTQPKHILTVRGIGYRWEGGQTSTAPAAEDSTPPQIDYTISEPDDLFVGRKESVAKINTHLQGGGRLITLLGPGGTGKTRLALHIAAARQHQSQSAIFIDLESVTTEESFIHQIATPLPFELNAEQSLEDRARHVGVHLAVQQDVLVILDNFEQVPSQCALYIANWLKAAPALKLIVTSREPLRIAHEHRIDVPPLDEDEAILLFEDRGRLNRSDFKVTIENREAVRKTVQKLDYLPLAIELAAARIKILSVSNLYKRLSKRLDILVDRRKDHTSRQKTLRATIDWSWQLLSQDEQEAALQCGIFRGGFSLQAAEEIFQLESGEGTLDLIESLHEKSLIRVIETPLDPEGLRFYMLDMIREYVAEKLRASGQFEAIAKRHQDYYLALGAELKKTLFSKEESINKIRLEQANILAIADHTDDPNTLVRCLALLDHVLTEYGPFDLHMELLERAVQQHQYCEPRLQVTALSARGRALRNRAQFERAEEDLREAIRLAQSFNLKDVEGRAYSHLATLLWSRVKVISAFDFFRKALEIHRELGDRTFIGVSLYQLALMNLEMGRFDKALALTIESEAICRQESNHYFAAMAAHYRGYTLLAQGDLDHSFELLYSAYKELAEHKSTGHYASTHYSIGLYYHLMGQFEGAIDWYQNGVNLFAKTADKRQLGVGYGWLATAQADFGLLMEANQSLDQAERIARVIHDSRALGCIEIIKGHLELGRARELHQQGGHEPIVERMIKRANDRIYIPPTSALTASCPSGVPLSDISQDVRFYLTLLRNAMTRTQTVISELSRNSK